MYMQSDCIHVHVLVQKVFTRREHMGFHSVLKESLTVTITVEGLYLK